MADRILPHMDRLIAALKQLNLTGREIADIIWLTLKTQESREQASTVISSTSEPIQNNNNKKQPSTSSETNLPTSSSSPPETTSRAEVYAKTDGSLPSQGNTLLINAPNPPSLRHPLTLARALRPLMQKISSGKAVVLDEQATANRIAEERIRIPVLKPALEPWLDLALVVDESNSMIFWRQTLQELQQLLEQSGVFRDVQTWGLVTDEQGKVLLRRGTGKKVRNNRLCSLRELVDPSGRRLILVVSDCVSAIWLNGEVISALKVWVKQSPVAIVQMLPQWLWLRTGLSLGSAVQLGSFTPGVVNQELLIKQILLWDDINFATGIKVPVLTLEPQVAATWSEMVAGKSYAKVAGFVFSTEVLSTDDSQLESASNEEQVSSFRLTASSIARKLASLLSAAPIITLPIVRLIQQAILQESQQVHVAEVFLAGILHPLSPITPETNPDEIQFTFINEEIRDLFLKAAPDIDSWLVVDSISYYFAQRLGKSLKEFYALLKKPTEETIQEFETGFSTKPFALVTAKVLRRLGGDYASFAQELEEQWKQVEEAEINGKKVLLKTFTFDVATVRVDKSKESETQITIDRTPHQAQYFTEDLGNGVTLEMVSIPSGKFLMGSPESEEGSRDDERPQHEVTVQPFFMGKYPITQAQWRAVANLPQLNHEFDPDPSGFKGDNLPVESVSWDDAVEFCDRLSNKTGKNYRLPSEAEWEYGCRAGTTTPFHFGETITPELANYDGNYTYGSGKEGEYREKTTPVGSFQVANLFGLFDMHGNVWEWCADHWHDNYEGAQDDNSAWIKDDNDNHFRLLRGGAWNRYPVLCRSAYRGDLAPGRRNDRIGFRVVVSGAAS